MAKSRLVGSYPVIGIRPTIDGRRGALDVRGSLEEQTMNMAKSAAKLFEENLKYSNGEPVKVVIADTTIGRVGESAACADKFRKEGVDITVTVTPCWCYGAETMDMDPQTIKAVWGFNGTERPGAVYLASVLATHAQKGLPAFGIYGHDVQEADDTSIPDDVKEKLLRFGRAAVAAASMRGKSYLQIGSVTMGIGGSIIDSDFIESYLGMRVESVDEVEPKPIPYDLIQHFQTIINYPLPGSSFAGRSNLCRYNIAFSVLRLLLETASRKQLPIEIMRTYFRVSPLQHKGFFLPISRLPLIPSFISPFGVFCHSLLHLTPSRLDR